jgi:hypothetical protein
MFESLGNKKDRLQQIITAVADNERSSDTQGAAELRKEAEILQAEIATQESKLATLTPTDISATEEAYVATLTHDTFSDESKIPHSETDTLPPIDVAKKELAKIRELLDIEAD